MVHRQTRNPIPLTGAAVQVAHRPLADETRHRVPTERDDQFRLEHPDLALGASPRASLCLLRCARARALLDGRYYFTHEDLHAVALGVLGHRLILRPEAEVEGKTVREVVAETDPRWRRHQPNACCRVEGCGYGSARQGLCVLHAQRWERSGRPGLAAWLASAPAVKQPPAGSACRIVHCRLWPQAASPLCHSHHNTGRANGRPDIEQFIADFASVPALAVQRIHLGSLAPQLKLEMQYALQCRHDERRGRIQPPAVNRVVDLLELMARM